MISLRFLLLLFVFAAGRVHGFNWERCQSIINKSSFQGEGVFTSTSGYSSSTGECSMLGKSEHDTKVFYLDNNPKIIDDIAKGHGEYLNSFLKIMGCSSKEYAGVSSELKNRFGNLLLMNTKNQYEYIKSQCKKFCWANSFNLK